MFNTLSHFVSLVSFFTPWKKSENQRFSDVFRGYRKRPVAWNGLIQCFSVFIVKHVSYCCIVIVLSYRFWLKTTSKNSISVEGIPMNSLKIVYLRRFCDSLFPRCRIFAACKDWDYKWRLRHNSFFDRKSDSF